MKKIMLTVLGVILIGFIINSTYASNYIPNWVKTNAKLWSQNEIGDTDFLKGMQYLLQNGFMKISNSTMKVNKSNQIPH